MATNQQYATTDTLTLPVGAGTKSGDPVAVGDIVGVALTDRDTDGNATVQVKPAPVFEISVESDTDPIAIGDPVYIDATGAVSEIAVSNTLFGHALAAVTATETATIPVRIA